MPTVDVAASQVVSNGLGPVNYLAAMLWTASLHPGDREPPANCRKVKNASRYLSLARWNVTKPSWLVSIYYLGGRSLISLEISSFSAVKVLWMSSFRWAFIVSIRPLSSYFVFVYHPLTSSMDHAKKLGGYQECEWVLFVNFYGKNFDIILIFLQHTFDWKVNLMLCDLPFSNICERLWYVL